VPEITDQSRFRAILFRSLAIPFAISIVIAIAAVFQVWRLLDAASWVDHSDGVMAEVREVEKYSNAIEAGTRGFLLTGDPGFVNPAVAAVEKIPSAFKRLGSMVADNPDQVQRVHDLQAIYATWLGYMTDLLRLKKSGGDYVGIMRMGTGEALTGRLRELTQQVVSEEVDLRTKRELKVHRFAVSSGWMAGGIFLLFLTASAASGKKQITELSKVYGATLSELEHSHAELEQKVEDRTKELRDKNRQLMLFRLLADGVKDYGIVFVDPLGYITIWTASAERLFGYRAPEIVGKHFSVFYRQDDLKRIALDQDLEQAVHQGEKKRRELLVEYGFDSDLRRGRAGWLRKDLTRRD
jgi:PAS domain S-box-containing protein